MALNREYIDVKKVFENTNCNFIQNEIKKGNQALALKLPGAKGLFSKAKEPSRTFAISLCTKLKKINKNRGYITTDELPAYGITKQEVARAKQLAKAEESDTIVFCFAEKKEAKDTLNYIANVKLDKKRLLNEN